MAEFEGLRLFDYILTTTKNGVSDRIAWGLFKTRVIDGDSENIIYQVRKFRISQGAEDDFRDMTEEEKLENIGNYYRQGFTIPVGDKDVVEWVLEQMEFLLEDEVE